MERTGKRPKVAERLWGRMTGLDVKIRVASLVFVVVVIAAMSFCQLGFWSIGVIDGKSVYLLLILGPLLLGSFMFGPVTGALLGLYAGVVVFAHAKLLPLDYYELYYMTPLNTFVLLTLMGFLSGLLFDFVLRRNPQGGVRLGLIALSCIALSFVASGLMAAGVIVTYSSYVALDIVIADMVNSPLGFMTQVLVDAAFMMLFCCMADVLMRKMIARGANRALLWIFRNWMLAISCCVFMLTSAVVFSATTIQAHESASAAMLSDVEYLAKQAESLESHQYGVILDGYDVNVDGYVVIVDEDGIILASDDNDLFPSGGSFMKSIGYEWQNSSIDKTEYAQSFLNEIVNAGELYEIQAMDANGVVTMDFAFIAAAKFDEGFTAVLRTADTVYASRLDAMSAITLLAIVLIAAIAILATVLLKRVVVRRISETNESLGKITGGNLNERVNVHDSREFISLSRGINTTVDALKGTILQVEQRNAQDLATAKAIQESALPRDFPPFPDIDRFDIYASMKTAKEVGGDFYDFFLIEDGSEDVSKLGFVMADVSGKGIPAALFMMTAKTQIRNYMQAGLPVNEAVDAANHQLCIGNDAGMFVTAWVGVLDYNTGELAYTNAGHNPPMLLHDGKWEWMKNVSGMPLGLFEGIPYDAYERQLQVGDMIYTYTDGVTEAMDAEGHLFGEERLERTLYAFADMNPRSVGVGVRRAITDFTLNCEQSDDITMLILKYGVPPEKQAVMILPADDKQLVHVYNFIHEELHRRNAPKSVYNPFDIAAEELFVNVCHYAYPDATPDNPGEVRIGFVYEANPPSLTVTIADDGIPYDPLAKPDAVTPDNIADVPIGGLGILMAKNSVDEMTYERVGESNVVTFRKGW